MSKRTVDPALLRTHFSPLCDAEGVELVDARLVSDADGPVLRVLVDVPNAEQLPPGSGGVTLEHCTRTSRAISAWLDDHEELIETTYRLEVSSPGVERPLVLLRDFARFSGKDIRLTLTAPIGQRKKSLQGHLIGVQGENVLVRDEHGEELSIPFEQVSKAQLVFRF